MGANDFVTLTQPIEGSSIAEAGWGTAAAKPIVLRFQVQLPAGTYHVHVNNAAANRNISVPFIVAGGEANTAVVKTVTIPGDTSGTWLTADGVIGATFDIVLAAGTSLTGGTAGVWGAPYLIAATAQFNILSSTANVARIADIGAKVDPDATGVYGAWKASEVDAKFRSERYFERTPAGFAAVTLAGVTDIQVYEAFSVKKCRDNPGTTYIGGSAGTNIVGQSSNGAVISRPGTNAVFLGVQANARLT